MIILDTNVISEVMKPESSPAVMQWLNMQAKDALFLTTITIAEVGAGIGKLPSGKRRDDLDARHTAFVGMFTGRILTFDLMAGLRFGSIIEDTRTKGIAVSFQDGMIAAIAASQRTGAAIATRDVQPFQGAGLKVINPWQHP